MAYNYVFKTIVVGETAVGKSSLCQRFCYDTCPQKYEQTIGIDFCSKIVQIDNQNIKVQFWDCAGCPTFRSVTKSYYRNAAIAFFVYDCSVKDSFKALEDWIREVKLYCDANVVMVLVHNKSDIASESQQISPDVAKQFASSHNMLFFETSSRLGWGVHECFMTSISHLYHKISAGGAVPDKGIRRTSPDERTLSISYDQSQNQSRLCGSWCAVM